MHGVNNPQILKMGESNFFFDQYLWDNADNVPASANHGVGDFSHQADVAAAIDKRDIAFRQCFSQFTGRFYIFRVVSGTGSAEDANSLQLDFLFSNNTVILSEA
jgi:hypothetical protein